MTNHDLARIRAILTGKQERAYWQMYSKAARDLLAELDRLGFKGRAEDELTEMKRWTPCLNKDGDAEMIERADGAFVLLADVRRDVEPRAGRRSPWEPCPDCGEVHHPDNTCGPERK